MDDNAIKNFTDQDVPEEKLDVPAAPATDEPGSGTLPVDDPRTDSGLDEDEVYSEGVEAAADIKGE